jgi:hypothetical protein
MLIPDMLPDGNSEIGKDQRQDQGYEIGSREKRMRNKD